MTAQLSWHVKKNLMINCHVRKKGHDLLWFFSVTNPYPNSHNHIDNLGFIIAPDVVWRMHAIMILGLKALNGPNANNTNSTTGYAFANLCLSSFKDSHGGSVCTLLRGSFYDVPNDD